MGLLPHELIHISISLLAAWWFGVRQGREWLTSILVGLAFGVFVDLDHFFDYGLFLLHSGSSISIPTFLSGMYFDWSGTLYIPLHGWEWVALMYLTYKFSQNKKAKILKIINYFPVAAAGLAGHLITDQFLNQTLPLTYFFLFRLAEGFRIEAVI